MGKLKWMIYKTFIIFFILLIWGACSQQKSLKNEIHIYDWNDKPVSTVSLAEIKEGKIIKTYHKNVEVEKQYDHLNKIPYLKLSFKDAPGFYTNRSYVLKINTSVYKISDFEIMSKNQSGNIRYMINEEPQEIGDDNVIKIETEN